MGNGEDLDMNQRTYLDFSYSGIASISFAYDKAMELWDLGCVSNSGLDQMWMSRERTGAVALGPHSKSKSFHRLWGLLRTD